MASWRPASESALATFMRSAVDAFVSASCLSAESIALLSPDLRAAVMAAVLRSLAPHAPAAVRQSLASESERWTVSYLDYDWSLNERASK